MKMLYIEDNEMDYELLIQHLKKGGIKDVFAIRVNTDQDLEKALEKDTYDIIVSDYNVPGMNPLDSLKMIRKYSEHVPFIVVSGLVGEESVAQMMKEGVDDFVIKSKLERICPVVKRAIRENEIRKRETQAKKIAEKAMLAKEEMIAIVYHDIKNPLAAIQLDAQMLEQLSYKTPDQETMEDLRLEARRILRTVNRLKNLVSDMLMQNTMRQESTESNNSFIIKRQHQNPLNVLNEVLDSYRPLIKEKKIFIEKEVLQRRMQGYFDKERIFQVLSNLLGNALKFTPEGGRIKISLMENSDGDNEFKIADSGPGLNSLEQDHLFEKFWTGGTGTGLGLFICKTIVEAHGGEIKAESGPDKGAIFSFRIPAVEVSSDSELYSRSEESSAPAKQSATIFVVDDDEDLREVMCWTLEKEGHQVLAYEDPHLALEEIEKGIIRPNLILLDYHMRGMNGKEFLLLKKEVEMDRDVKVPVVMISAAPKEIRNKVDPDLYEDVLIKPVDLKRLINAIEHELS
jgi:signal transduction histidine kinase